MGKVQKSGKSKEVIVAIIGLAGVIIAAILGPWAAGWFKATDKRETKDSKAYIVSGLVIDERSNEGIENAEVFVVGGDDSEKDETDSYGKFIINLKTPRSQVKIRASRSAYRTKTVPFNAPDSGANIILQPL